MESISNIKIVVPQVQKQQEMAIATTNRNKETLCVVSGKEMNYFVDENGNFQLSQYTDEVATNEQIKGLLELIFAAFGFTEAEKIPMIMTVARAKMTVNQLTDSINNILSTLKFKPKPAEIVQWNKPTEEIRTFNLKEAGRMASGIVRWYYDFRKYENYKRSIELWEKAMKLYFDCIKKDGRPVKICGISQYSFTEAGLQEQTQLLKFLNMEDFQIENYTTNHHKEKTSKNE